MKTILSLIFAAFLLTSCSNPDTSGGVTLSRGADDGNEFPHGACYPKDPDFGTYNTGCGWVLVDDQRHYIKPGADLSGALLDGANLSGANLYLANLENTKLRWANLTGAILSYAKLRSTDLNHANLSGAGLHSAEVWRTYLGGANLTGADLRGADLNNVLADSRTICPNGIRWLTAGNNCPF